jgi:hypothetical protein
VGFGLEAFNAYFWRQMKNKIEHFIFPNCYLRSRLFNDRVCKKLLDQEGEQWSEVRMDLIGVGKIKWITDILLLHVILN